MTAPSLSQLPVGAPLLTCRALLSSLLWATRDNQDVSPVRRTKK
jgi:hypothetical protein